MDFDLNKIKLVMLYVSSKQNWSIDLNKLLTVMFIADKQHISTCGDKIVTGEYEYSPSRKILSKKILKDDLTLDPRDFVVDEIKSKITVDTIKYELSKSEIDALDYAYDYVSRNS